MIAATIFFFGIIQINGNGISFIDYISNNGLSHFIFKIFLNCSFKRSGTKLWIKTFVSNKVPLPLR